MFKDNDLLWILDEIIDSINTAEDEDLVSIYLLDEDIDPNTGIPIGNYLSQYSGNYYLAIGVDYIRNAVIIGFMANELISIVENAGLMGLPLPDAINKAIDVLTEQKEG